jgi:Ulp1 family protease
MHTAIEISKDYHKHLHPKGWLNDVLIDFWMQWITRMEFQPDSSIHVFSTHFYAKLEYEGVNSVLSWKANWGIDVFSKKFIFAQFIRISIGH